MKNIYKDQTYLNNNPTWHEEDSPWKAKQILKILNQNQIWPATICEVGCGAGEILKQLSLVSDDTVEYFGYEISPDAFSICEKKSKNNLTFYLKDLLQDDDSWFDVLLCIDVFEHVDDCYGFLKKLKGKAKYKVFHIPLDLTVSTLIRVTPLEEARKNFGHIHHFTRETALATLEYSGYKVLDSFYTYGSLDLPNLGWKAKLLKIPRKVLFLLSGGVAQRFLGGCALMVLAE